MKNQTFHFFKSLSASFLLISCFTARIYSQKQFDFSIYTISRLTPDDGLSQGSNYFRFEDSKGFMWITGNDAVNRYDGETLLVRKLQIWEQ